jgi:hypothetical protein
MRNLLVIVMAYAALLMAGCTTPCSGCRICSPASTVAGCTSRELSVISPDGSRTGTSCGSGGCSAGKCSRTKCAIGSPAPCATAVEVECASPPEVCDITPESGDSPSLAGGGHCGQSCSNSPACLHQVLLDWQQSTGVDDTICTESACATPNVIEPLSCAAPAGCIGCTSGSADSNPAHSRARCTCGPNGCSTTESCTCRSGSGDCKCSNDDSDCTCSVGNQTSATVAEPNLVSDRSMSAPQAVHDTTDEPSGITAPLQLEPAASAPLRQTTPETASIVPVPASLTPLAPSESTQPVPAKVASPESLPLIFPRGSVEGTPIKGYRGRGCPVHGQATSPDKPDVSSSQQPRQLPGFHTGEFHQSQPLVRPVSGETTNQQPPNTAGEGTTKSDSPFDWKPKPRVKIESNGWKATPRDVERSAKLEKSRDAFETPIFFDIAGDDRGEKSAPALDESELDSLPMLPLTL